MALATLQIAVETSKVKRATDELKNLEKQGSRAENATNRLTKSSKSLAGALTSLPSILTAITASLGIRQFVQYADAMTQVESKLKLVTNSTSQLLSAQQDLFEIAQLSRVSFTDTVDLYSRMARSTKELNISQSDLLGITSTINKALIVSGSSAESANAALIQLGQGFASGTLRGEELNSVMEQTPRLAQAIAEGMGISVGQLRALGAEGKLTAEAVVNALKTQAEAVDSEFKNMGTTVDQSMIQVTNAMSNIIGNIDDATGATTRLSSGLTSLSEQLVENQKQIGEILYYITSPIAGIELFLTSVSVAFNTIPLYFEDATLAIEKNWIEFLYEIQRSAKQVLPKFSAEYLGFDDTAIMSNKKAMSDIEQQQIEIAKKVIEYQSALEDVANSYLGLKNVGVKALSELDNAQGKVAEEASNKTKTTTEKNLKDNFRTYEDYLNNANNSVLEAYKKNAKITSDEINKIFNEAMKGSVSAVEESIKYAKDQIGSGEFTGVYADTAMTDAEFEVMVKERTAYWNKELKNTVKNQEKLWENVSDIAKDNITSGIQDAFDGDFDMNMFTSNLSKSVGQAMLQSGNPYAMAGGLGLMAVGSLLGQDGGKTAAQQRAEQIQAIQDQTNSIVNALEDQTKISTNFGDNFEALRIGSFEAAKTTFQGEIDTFLAAYISRLDAGTKGSFIELLQSLAENHKFAVAQMLLSNSYLGETNQYSLDFKTAVGEYTNSLLDVRNTYNDLSDSLKDVYDGLNNNYYAELELANAREEVISLLGGATLNESNFSNYLSDVITGLDSFDTSIETLKDDLSSTDVRTQVAALRKLEEVTGTSFEENTASALDYLDSIELVGKSMADAQKTNEDIIASNRAIQDTINREMLGSLSYLSEAGKLAYANNIYQSAITPEDRVSSARSIAELSQSNTRTREDYVPVFAQYINELQKQKEEATLNDVVTKLDEVVTAIEDQTSTQEDSLIYTA